MPKKETQFHGILAVGRTKADAVNNYRLLTMSKGATVQVDSERNIAFVTQASNADGMFNPLSGNMDLETDDKFLEQLEFKSHSSGDVEVNHLVCKSGCGAHIVFDSAALVQYCTNCTSSLSSEDEDDTAEDDEDDESVSDDDGDSDEDDLDAELGSDDEDDDEESDTSESADEEEGDDSDEEGSEDAEGDDSDEEGSEDAADADADADESETEGDDADNDETGKDTDDDAADADDVLPDYTEDDGTVKIESSESNGLIIAASSFDEATNLFRANLPKTSLSADQAQVEAHYMLCKDTVGCGAHLVSTEAIVACCACQGEVVEPETEAAVEEVAPKAEVAVEKGVAKVEASDDEDKDDEDKDSNTLNLSDDEGNILDEDTEDVDAMSDVDDDEESDSSDLDVSYSSSVAGQSRWTAFYKGVPCAMASKSSAGKNADIFDTPSFGHAALATAKVSGIRKALVELGFAPIKHKVSVSKVIRKLVTSQVAERETAIASEQQQFKDRFMSALATAAIGLNRGFFTEKKNPIKATLWNAMSSAGIRNPETLIDSAYKSHSDAYHKTLFELASDLVSKSSDVQESLSKAIMGMSYQEASTSSAGESIEGRLETFGTSISSSVEAKQEMQPATAVDRTNITKAVSSLGRRSR